MFGLSTQGYKHNEASQTMTLSKDEKKKKKHILRLSKRIHVSVSQNLNYFDID